mgnify:CR=1 FL=1
MGLFAKFKEAWLKPMSFDSLNEDSTTIWRRL